MNVSSQAQAVILLTVPLGNSEAKPLSVTEWTKLASWLKEHELGPSSLLRGDLRLLLSGWMDEKITLVRIERLLDRGGALGLALEKWHRTGLWIITRPDAEYPERLKRRLRNGSPPVLFGCGNRALLCKGGIAVVGSRDADEDDISFSSNLGRAAAQQGLSVVSGAARGVDESAMLGALQNEGTAIGVMADSLLRAATSAKYRKYLSSGDLVLVSPFNPEAGFNVGNAMARNKYIYCLSDAAVVVNSTPNKGGTWNGAVEDLKSEWVPLWVKRKDNPASGNSVLVQKGARWFPEKMPTLSNLWERLPAAGTMKEPSTLPLLHVEAITAMAQDITSPPAITTKSSETSTKTPPKEAPPADSGADEKLSELKDDFYALFLERMIELTGNGPLKIDEIAQRLELEKKQVNTWLTRGVADGKINKLSKPVRYQSTLIEERQASLFGGER